jgi:hypothetical protein
LGPGAPRGTKSRPPYCYTRRISIGLFSRKRP